MMPCALTAAALALSMPRPTARAEDSIAYVFENYREEDGRITVVTESSSVNEDIAAYGHIQLTGTVDAVAGATPTGRPAQPGSGQVALAQIDTRRKAWNGDYSGQIGNLNIDAGFAQSREDDYVSTGWSVNTLTDFNQKNTTLRAGIAGTSDRVEVIFEPGYLPKHTADAIVGITQLLSPTTFVTLNVSAGRSTGYLSEPYKIVEKAVEILPSIFLDEEFAENSPNVRDRESVYASVNRSFSRVRGALEEATASTPTPTGSSATRSSCRGCSTSGRASSFRPACASTRRPPRVSTTTTSTRRRSCPPGYPWGRLPTTRRTSGCRPRKASAVGSRPHGGRRTGCMSTHPMSATP